MSLVFKQLYNGDTVKTNNGLVFKLLNTNGGSGGESKDILVELLDAKLDETLYSSSACAVGDNIYIVGGFTKFDIATLTQKIRKFNISTETFDFNFKAKTPKAIHSPAVESVGDLVYSFGGETISSQIKDIYVMNTKTDYSQKKTISTLNTGIPIATAGKVAFRYGTFIYLFGGYNRYSITPIYKFDTTSETTTTISITIGTSRGSAVLIGNIIYITGYKGKIVKFDVITEKLIGEIETKSYGVAAYGVGTNIYKFGGSNTPQEINKFDTVSETMTTLNISLPFDITSTTILGIGQTVYLFGGENSSEALNTVIKVSNLS